MIFLPFKWTLHFILDLNYMFYLFSFPIPSHVLFLLPFFLNDKMNKIHAIFPPHEIPNVNNIVSINQLENFCCILLHFKNIN